MAMERRKERFQSIDDKRKERRLFHNLKVGGVLVYFSPFSKELKNRRIVSMRSQRFYDTAFTVLDEKGALKHVCLDNVRLEETLDHTGNRRSISHRLIKNSSANILKMAAKDISEELTARGVHPADQVQSIPKSYFKDFPANEFMSFTPPVDERVREAHRQMDGRVFKITTDDASKCPYPDRGAFASLNHLLRGANAPEKPQEKTVNFFIKPVNEQAFNFSAKLNVDFSEGFETIENAREAAKDVLKDCPSLETIEIYSPVESVSLVHNFKTSDLRKKVVKKKAKKKVVKKKAARRASKK